MSCSEAQGPHSHLTDRPSTYFAPSPYRGPQRRNPDMIDADTLKAHIEEQAEKFRRNN